MQKFWEDSYKSKEIPLQLQPTTASIEPNQNTFRAWEQSRKKARVLGDEYQRYYNIDVIKDIADPRNWWQEPSQRLNYPNLSGMALDNYR